MTKYSRLGIKYGLLLGLFNSLVIYLSNVVFPSNGPDNAALTAFWAIAMFAIFCFIGYRISFSGAKPKPSGHAAAVAAFVAFSLTILAFAVVDNAYLSVVSQQTDKITAFSNSHSNSLRSFINQGLLVGYLVGAPFVIITGFFAGKLGVLIFARK